VNSENHGSSKQRSALVKKFSFAPVVTFIDQTGQKSSSLLPARQPGILILLRMRPADLRLQPR
jgi:hypothetical protein